MCVCGNWAREEGREERRRTDDSCQCSTKTLTFSEKKPNGSHINRLGEKRQLLAASRVVQRFREGNGLRVGNVTGNQCQFALSDEWRLALLANEAAKLISATFILHR